MDRATGASQDHRAHSRLGLPLVPAGALALRLDHLGARSVWSESRRNLRLCVERAAAEGHALVEDRVWPSGSGPVFTRCYQRTSGH